MSWSEPVAEVEVQTEPEEKEEESSTSSGVSGSSGAEWNGAIVDPWEWEYKLVKYYIRTEPSDRVAAVLGLE